MESPDEALKRSRDLVKLPSKGGFKLTKFISNVPGLLDELEDQSVETVPKVIGASMEESSSHVLGLKWDHTKDTLVVSRSTSCDSSKAVTQRFVLSLVAEVFDPIGLIAPFTVTARLLLKDVWRLHGQSRDKKLPNEMIDRFSSWSSKLPTLALLNIPRCYFSGHFEHLELHVIGDRSQEVYSAVAFLRALVSLPSEIKRTELAYVIGKARGAPMKTLTVPKLELQAALLAARLREETFKALTVPVQTTFMWTDSTTVLQCLNSLDKQPIFVANRVSAILEGTSVDQWHHVASHANPADAGTRGMSSEALQKSSWLHGPQFLRTSDFPFQPNTYVIKNIKLKSHSTEASSSEKTSTLITDVFKMDFSLPFRMFSSYPKLLRILAYCMRLLPRHLAYRSSGEEIVDPEELNDAERKLQLITQSESFPLERQQLAQEKQINKKSRIAVYSPFIGTGGLLRSTGRVKRLAEIDSDLKHPIILD